MKKTTTLLLTVILAISIMATGVLAADAHEAIIDGTLGPNVTKTYAAAASVTAKGGNITTLNITMEKQTSVWAGFFGNVTHSLVLAGGTNNFYQWSGLTDSTGAVLFANSSTVDWASIGTTVDGNHDGDEDTALSINPVNTDSVTNTFGGVQTASFDVNGVTFDAGNSGIIVTTTSQGGTDWETVMLQDGSNVVYAGPIQQNNPNYAGVNSDYQVMLPVDNAGTRTYYLFAALN